MTNSKTLTAALFGVVVAALAGGSAMAQSYRTDTYASSSYDRAQQRANDVKELNSDSGLAAHRDLLSPRSFGNQGRDSQYIGQYNRD
ncbi:MULTISPECIES: hypothetical protein [unclassified Beijerinckia]|uniref:hypothetical protein n=1 Tax=unclassified Beijerinckia TaxID=2638183 RepID=UPI000895E09D|nr:MULTISPECIES: hypothetical protein [unclassified Beijerinckia]MDH7799745.1 hypothetical protein [Beijerinckia sp. GAS462]SED35739.1 hypothetical protein SAMN05443249_5163 [Beijerinckia sp. 28-YEA-48]